jgi:hypothetical protein
MSQVADDPKTVYSPQCRGLYVPVNHFEVMFSALGLV